MEQKPHKKEELMVANSVLKLAEDLLKVTFNYSSIVHSSGVARLLAVYVTCFQPPQALRPRTGPMHNPSNTVYFSPA